MIVFSIFLSVIIFTGTVMAGFTGTQSELPGSHAPAELYFPFHIHIDPMERLLLVNIENDPDTLYIGFEPQLFDDAVNGQGMLVIAWRTDGYVDVYHQPGLKIQPEKYDIAGNGLAHLVEAPLEGAYFRVEDSGVQAWFKLYDLWGREIEVNIQESHPGKRKPFGLLAPMGDAARNPSAMPMVFLHDFYFVRQKHTHISIRINGKNHMPDKLPMPLDRRKMYFARYSPDPLIATLNPAHQGPLAAFPHNGTRTTYRDNITLQLEHTGEGYAVKKMSVHHEAHQLNMGFSPAFPDINQWSPGKRFKGNFRIWGHHTTGHISGHYTLDFQDGRYVLHMIPHKGWKPRAAGKVSLRFLYTVAGIFRNWPKTYQWTAHIDFNEEGVPVMESDWKRISR